MKTLSFFLVFFTSIFFITGCKSPKLPTFFGPKVKKEYFTGGKLRSEFIMEKENEQNGILKKYGYAGRLTSVAHIKNGVNDGIEIWYDKQGRRLMEVPYVNGKKHGIQKAFYPNGDIMISTTYQNNMKHGKAVAYSKDGRIYKQAMFQHGKILN